MIVTCPIWFIACLVILGELDEYEIFQSSEAINKAKHEQQKMDAWMKRQREITKERERAENDSKTKSKSGKKQKEGPGESMLEKLAREKREQSKKGKKYD